MIHLNSALVSWHIPELPAELRGVASQRLELEVLIRLDEKDINEQEQDIYLWHKGFKTGVRVGYEEIGRKYGISSEDVQNIISRVESLCIG